MKSRLLQTVLFTVYTGVLLPAFGQKSYYVVVGAFSTEQDVKEFTTRIPNTNLDTAYAFTDQENLMHFYVFRTTNADVALAKTQQLQKQIEMSGSMPGGYESISLTNTIEHKNVTIKKSASAENSGAGSSMSESAGSKTPSAIPEPASGRVPLNPKGKLFKFMLTNHQGLDVPGQVHFVDLRKQRDVATFSANTYADILQPAKKRELAFVCGIFGYKEVQKYVDYSDPSSIEDAYQDQHGAWIIPYKLERLTKGDVSVMYNVAFHKDAVIMLPDSRKDLDELVRMMYENPNYEITIHGHCNGNNNRKIIAHGSEQSFFDINGSEEINGTSKMLSGLRAQTVKTYLVQNGIEAKRIKTFAWGGKYMLVDQNSTHARLNDRIEIEIRKD